MLRVAKSQYFTRTGDARRICRIMTRNKSATPQSPKRSSAAATLVKLLGGTAVLTGAGVGLATYEPRFRRLFNDTPVQPALDLAIKQIQVLLNLDDSSVQEAKKAVDVTQADDPANVLSNVQLAEIPMDQTTSNENAEMAAKKDPVLKEAAKKERLLKEAEEEAEKKRLIKEAEEAAERNRLLKEAEEAAERSRLLKETEEAAELAALEHSLESIREEADELVQAAVQALKQTVDVTNDQLNKLKAALADEQSDIKEDQWTVAAEAMEVRQKLSKLSDQTLELARNRLVQLEEAVNEGKGQIYASGSEQMEKSKSAVLTLRGELLKAVAELESAQEDNTFVETLSRNVDQAKQQLLDELNAVTANLNFEQGVDKLSESQLGILLSHAYLRMKQLRSLADNEEERVARTVQQNIKDQISNNHLIPIEVVKAQLDEIKESLEQAKQQWMHELNESAEADLRQQLTRQAAAHRDHLSQALKEQEGDLRERYDMQLEETVEQEKKEHCDFIEQWSKRIVAIQQASNARAETEAASRQSQELWMACLALNEAITAGNAAAADHEDTRRPLLLEVEAVRAAAESTLEPLLDSLPSQALERGVATERELKYRFYKMERTCRRVALVPENNNSLGRYLLSVIQSMFIFDSVQALSDEDSLNIKHLSNLQLLAHAKHCIRDENIELATRFLNQLQGESRFVAEDWLTDARLLLETRQSACAMSSYATAVAVSTLLALGLNTPQLPEKTEKIAAVSST